MNTDAKIFQNVSKQNPAIRKKNKTPPPSGASLRNARLAQYLKKKNQ